MKFLFITLIEIIYIIYFFNFFKTTIVFTHPLEKIFMNNLSGYFRHPIEVDSYSNKICDFGHMASYLISFYLAIRLIAYYISNTVFAWFLKHNSRLFIIIFVVCFLNLNAVVYILPLVLYEVYLV